MNDSAAAHEARSLPARSAANGFLPWRSNAIGARGSVIEDMLTLALATFAALLPITNPFSTAPIFATITHRMSPQRRREQARMACVYAFSVLTVALLIGALILTFFGVSIHALRVAGGLVVARIGFGMLHAHPEEEIDDEARAEAMDAQDVAFTPIAMPMLSGPGSIAATIGMATEVTRPVEYLAIILGIGLVSVTAWLVLRSSAGFVAAMGATGVTILTRIMGLLLVGIGVQFLFAGILGAVTSEFAVTALMDALARASAP